MLSKSCLLSLLQFPLNYALLKYISLEYIYNVAVSCQLSIPSSKLPQTFVIPKTIKYILYVHIKYIVYSYILLALWYIHQEYTLEY